MWLIIFGGVLVFISGILLGIADKYPTHESSIKAISGLLIFIGGLCMAGGINAITHEAKEAAINEYLNGEIEVEMEEVKTYKIK